MDRGRRWKARRGGECRGGTRDELEWEWIGGILIACRRRRCDRLNMHDRGPVPLLAAQGWGVAA